MSLRSGHLPSKGCWSARARSGLWEGPHCVPIADALSTLESKLSGLISLSADERRSLNKMGENPGLIPADVDVAEAQRDLAGGDRSRGRERREHLKQTRAGVATPVKQAPLTLRSVASKFIPNQANNQRRDQ